MLLLCAVHFDRLRGEELWLLSCESYSYTWRLLSIGPKHCDALPVFHALTGCDSNSTVSRIGMKKAWDALKRSKVHQESLTMLGQQQDLDETTATKCEAFMCDLYAFSRRTPKTPDELRCFMFCQMEEKKKFFHQRLTVCDSIWNAQTISRPQ